MKINSDKEVAEAKVELIPLIDCVFLLLIFFMCAATMTKKDTSSEVRLPIASNAAEQKDPSHRGTVNVLPVGSRTPGGEVVTAEKPFLVYGALVDEAGLQREIAERAKADPLLKLYLRADRNVKFDVVRRAMAACAAAGISDVVFGSYVQDLYEGG